MNDNLPAVNISALQNVLLCFETSIKEMGFKKRNALLATLLVHDFEEIPLFNVFVEAMYSNTVDLPEFYKDGIVAYVPQLHFNKQLEAQIFKYRSIAYIDYLEHCLECVKNPVIENVLCRVVGNQNLCVVAVPPSANFELPKEFDQVLIAFGDDLSSIDEGFYVYEGYPKLQPDGGVLILFSNGNVDNDEINEKRKVTVYPKPVTHEFEDRLRGLKAFEENRDIQNKLKPQEVDDLNVHHDADILHEGAILNTLQRRAHTEMRHLNANHAFVLWGPPGTGKTTTLAEFVSSLLMIASENPQAKITKNDDVRILITCQTNSAADCFTEALLKRGIVRILDVARVNANSREFKDVTAVVKSVSFHQNENFYIPKLDELKKYQIVIATIGATFRFHDLGTDYFTHIIFEEAGQIMELDVYRPLGAFCSKPTKLYFAGDPEQLAPIVVSQSLAKLGYSVVLPTILVLSRDSIYYNYRNYMVQLKENYRNTVPILDIFSNLSYNDKLEAKYVSADEGWSSRQILGVDYQEKGRGAFDSNMFVRWHICLGEERRHDVSKSLYNFAEVEVLIEYIKRCDSAGVSFDTIGIIAPYRAQVELIREQLIAVDPKFRAIKCDTVDAFQGLERSILFLLTVREMDIGFLQDRRRFNTAISRAKKLLVFIGNPFVFLETNMGGHLNYSIRLMRLLKKKKMFYQSPEELEDGSMDTTNLVDAIENCIPPELPDDYQIGNVNEREDLILARQTYLK